MKKITKEDIKKDLIKIFEQTGQTPTLLFYKEHGNYGHSTIDRKFGGWHYALMETFGHSNINHRTNLNFKVIECFLCGKEIRRRSSQINRVKHVFCSTSCAAKYNNAHKTKGTRRSKLEVWIEEQLNNTYPDLEILYNNKNAIQSELDIYIPSLSLAFELNGIFHYEPIFGNNKLSSIRNNDECKFKKCIDKKINLCIIDVSGLKYFKTDRTQKYLNIIINIIDNAREI